MRKRKTLQWTDDLTNSLLECRRIAELKKDDGNTRALVNLVYEEWNKNHAKLKATKGALKIKLSMLRRSLDNQGHITNEHVDTALENDMDIETKPFPAV